MQLNQPVIDKTGTLTPSEIQQLSQKIKVLWLEEKLVQTGVIIVPTTGQQAIFDYCMTVAKKWRLGSADKNNGLLMCFAMQDKKMYILTGTGIEKILPNERVKDIIDTQIAPYFKVGKFDDGINQGLDVIVDELREKQDLIGTK